MGEWLHEINTNAIDKRIQEVNDFFDDPKNIERIEKNRNIGEQNTEYFKNRQETLVEELYNDISMTDKQINL